MMSASTVAVNYNHSCDGFYSFDLDKVVPPGHLVRRDDDQLVEVGAINGHGVVFN